MNKLKVVQGSGLGIVEHWNWLQDGIKKAFEHVLSNLTAENPMFRISGATVTEGDPDNGEVEVSITSGAICFNGEPVEVVAHSVTRTVEQVAWIGIEEVAVDTTPVLNQTTGQGDSVMKRRRGVLTIGSNYPAPGTYCPIDAPTMNAIYASIFGGNQMRKGDIVDIWVSQQELYAWYSDDDDGLGIPGTPGENRAICNGKNETPDLRGKVRVEAITSFPGDGIDEPLYEGVNGGEQYAPGAEFGFDKVALDNKEMPYHRHSYTDYVLVNLGGVAGYIQTGSGPVADSVANKQTGYQGGDPDDDNNTKPHENRQPSKAFVPVMILS